MQNSSPFAVASMAVDWNDMLHLHVVNGLQEWPCMQESWGYPCAQQTSVSSDGTVLWSCPFLPLPLTTSGKRSMYYAMRMTEDKTVDTERDSAHFVTDKTEGCFSVLQRVAMCCCVLHMDLPLTYCLLLAH